MADLSPAAQAVLDAAIDAYWKEAHLGRRSIAAALRAAGNHCTHDRLTLYCLAEELEGAGAE